jgi:response regulator of citrate/malate metabolism
MAQYRVKVTYKFEPDEVERPGQPVKRFKLVQELEHQTRRSEREIWRMDTDKTPSHARNDLATGLSRSTLSALIADAADWLTYIEEG